jgi:hypothetical protein
MSNQVPPEVVSVPLTVAQINALLQLCDAVALRGPASKILVAQAQEQLMRALEAARPVC